MSKDFDNNIRKIIDTNKELHKDTDRSVKELLDIKKSIKNIDNKLASLESKIDQIFEILNTFSIMMYEEGDELDDDIENEDWNPYDDHNWEVNGGDDSYYPEDFSEN